MHIPDGMLEARTWIPAWIGSAGVLAYGIRRVRRTLSDATIVLMAVMAALIFALQLLNFPVAGGTSGHFAGGAAAAIVLGLWPAMVVMSAVVLVQAVLFADGGITALGANMLTMAILAPSVGWLVNRAIARDSASRSVRLTGAFAAGWASTVTAAVAVGVLLWLSGRAPLPAILAAMGTWHALIGLGEGAITAGLVGYLLAVRPDLLAAAPVRAERGLRRIAVGLGIAALIAAALSFAASPLPDGLEYAYSRVGETFRQLAPFDAPLGQGTAEIGQDALATVLAAIVGAIVTGVASYTLLKAAMRRRGKSEAGS